MFIFSFCTVGNSYLKAENDDAPIVWRDWKTAVTTLFGVSFLALGRLVHLDPQVRGVTNILGWLLVLLSFSLPKSRWQPITFFTIYAIALSGVKWRQFLAFSTTESHLLIGFILLWLAISGSIYLFLLRRKPTDTS